MSEFKSSRARIREVWECLDDRMEKTFSMRQSVTIYHPDGILSGH
jgi:hypothetical protein